MVQEYEDNIIPPPLELRDGWKPTPTLRRKKMIVPVAASRTKVEEKSKALKECTKSFETGVKNDTDPLKHWNKKSHSVQTHTTVGWNESFEIC